jgi:predicted HicB family RNase H-like nuclease
MQMTYKGYTGVLEIDEDSGELFGTVLGTRDVITFVGKTVDEARKSLEESVDFYLERCAATGKDPDRPFSGRFNVRISSETHRALAEIAHSRKVSLNDLVAGALDEVVAGVNQVRGRGEIIQGEMIQDVPKSGLTPRQAGARRKKSVAG